MGTGAGAAEDAVARRCAACSRCGGGSLTSLTKRVVADRDSSAFDCLRRVGQHSSGFLTLNEGTSRYVDPRLAGFIAYRPAGRRHAIQLCGPVAPARDRQALLRSFLRWAASEERRVTAVQLTRGDAILYAEHGFTVNQLGASYSIDLRCFTLSGTRFMRLRNKVKRARRSGVTVREWGWDEQRGARGSHQLAEIDRAWLRGKGALAKELVFMVGERNGPNARERRLFVGADGAGPLAYATYSPCFGDRPGWLYDLTRRRPDAPAGAIELLFLTALERFVDEGCGWLHLGFTPMAQLDARHELPSSSRTVTAVLRLVARHGELIYPARSQEHFKLKWAPHAIEPEYIAFAPRVSVGALWHLLRVTRAI
ncbi:MAG: DUF2156 domain-containing protein [Actinobacteria bacterium]|nr:DUF2156 domain-containing protein [Actinomycetota bacterium]